MSSQTFCMSKNILLIVFSATLAVSTYASFLDHYTNHNVSQIFEDWIIQHNRTYSNSEEKAQRFEIFKADYLEIQKYNEEHGFSYTKGFNKFSDMMVGEFLAEFGCCCSSVDQDVATPSVEMLDNYSDSLVQIMDCHERYIDWSKDEPTMPSPLSAVRHQINCGSCWAIAAVEAVEAATRITNGPGIPLEKLSVQQVVDCAFGAGCLRGSILDAYSYIVKNGGLASDRAYRHTDKSGTCDKTRARKVVGGSIMGFLRLLPPEEETLEEAVCRAPVTADIDASSREFVKYLGGMFKGPCGNSSDGSGMHSILVVGYGEDDDGTKYWKIMNSWGTNWGDGGFMKMSYEAGRKCDITRLVTFPIVKY